MKSTSNQSLSKIPVKASLVAIEDKETNTINIKDILSSRASKSSDQLNLKTQPSSSAINPKGQEKKSKDVPEQKQRKNVSASPTKLPQIGADKASPGPKKSKFYHHSNIYSVDQYKTLSSYQFHNENANDLDIKKQILIRVFRARVAQFFLMGRYQQQEITQNIKQFHYEMRKKILTSIVEVSQNRESIGQETKGQGGADDQFTNYENAYDLVEIEQQFDVNKFNSDLKKKEDLTGKFIVEILYYQQQPSNPRRLQSRGIKHTHLQDYLLQKYAEFMENDQLEAQLRFERITKGYEKVLEIVTKKNFAIEFPDNHTVNTVAIQKLSDIPYEKNLEEQPDEKICQIVFEQVLKSVDIVEQQKFIPPPVAGQTQYATTNANQQQTQIYNTGPKEYIDRKSEVETRQPVSYASSSQMNSGNITQNGAVSINEGIRNNLTENESEFVNTLFKNYDQNDTRQQIIQKIIQESEQNRIREKLFQEKMRRQQQIEIENALQVIENQDQNKIKKREAYETIMKYQKSDDISQYQAFQSELEKKQKGAVDLEEKLNDEFGWAEQPQAQIEADEFYDRIITCQNTFLEPNLSVPRHQECDFDIPQTVQFQNYEDREIMNVVFQWENEIQDELSGITDEMFIDNSQMYQQITNMKLVHAEEIDKMISEMEKEIQLKQEIQKKQEIDEHEQFEKIRREQGFKA